MEIWIINHYAVPPGGPGVQRHAIFAMELARRGHSVTVICSERPHAVTQQTIQVPPGRMFEDRMYGILRYRFIKNRPYGGNITRFLGMREFGRHVVQVMKPENAPDVILGSSVHLHAADAGRQLAEHHGARFILEVRDLWPDLLVDIGGFTRLNPVYHYLKRIERCSIRAAHKVIGVMPGIRNYLNDQGYPDKPCVHIPNGFDGKVFFTGEPPDRESAFVFTSWGSQGITDDLDRVIRAFHLLRSRHPERPMVLNLIGDGTERAKLERLVSELGLEGVRFQGVVGKERLREFGIRSDVFILTHAAVALVKRYGTGTNKIYEYLALGKPVVYACESYLSGIAQSGAGVEVKSGDPEALAKAMEHFLTMPETDRRAIGAMGCQWVWMHNELGVLGQSFADTMAEC